MDLIFGGILVLLFIAAVSLSLYYQRKNQINHLPHNNPKAFLEKGLRQEGKKLVAVIGGDAVHATSATILSMMQPGGKTAWIINSLMPV
ncbi:hypothetical protein [Mesobacillus boroniphilus]|uniref:Uncharacterized protein n=1 Tax=Mesobacillus boroniphilus JCM 21738 TaxID=1294265 RepID=W4RVA7_9BACI|nr:hypothetical protein [Mesobacillus boroniphilus]GAE48350.1 hypothetical protein JCM21738_5464 [Mesobacillus boroniphilus JCM 21738]